MQEFKPVKEGKVREIFDIGDAMIIVTTDRISAFDHILRNRVPGKGEILTRMSKFWFDFTEDLVPNHMLTIDNKEMPPYFQAPVFQNKSMKCKKLTMLPVECIVRGYITGSGWESYRESGQVCGIRLPEGLKECEKLPEPIYTPTTKAEIGLHDENISFEQTAALLDKQFPGKGEAYAAAIRDLTVAIYKKCSEYAAGRGILIADTKFEFGLDEDGTVTLGDEILTPDSSRFWPADGYEPGKSQPSYDKQFVRDYLKSHPDSDFILPEEVVNKTIAKYKEAYLKLTGEEI